MKLTLVVLMTVIVIIHGAPSHGKKRKHKHIQSKAPAKSSNMNATMEKHREMWYCLGGDDCCTNYAPYCYAGEGDCDTDSECATATFSPQYHYNFTT